ncbi:sodium/hydrogen exchanger family protein, partial [Neisseria meningitidis 64182]
MMPPVTGVPNSHLLFDVAFAVVVLSLLIRGMTIPVMARLLKVAMPNKPEPKDTHDIWLAKKEIVRMSAFKVVAESEAEGHHPDTVEPISDSFGARCFALIRNGIRIEMQSDTVLQAGVAVEAVFFDGEVDVDNVAFFERLVVGNAVADDVVDGG